MQGPPGLSGDSRGRRARQGAEGPWAALSPFPASVSPTGADGNVEKPPRAPFADRTCSLERSHRGGGAAPRLC